MGRKRYWPNFVLLPKFPWRHWRKGEKLVQGPDVMTGIGTVHFQTNKWEEILPLERSVGCPFPVWTRLWTKHFLVQDCCSDNNTHWMSSNFPISFLPSVNTLSLLLHRAFWRFAEYHTPTNALIVYHIHSFSILSDDRSKASSKTMPPHSAIQSLLLQMRISPPVLKVIQ